MMEGPLVTMMVFFQSESWVGLIYFPVDNVLVTASSWCCVLVVGISELV